MEEQREQGQAGEESFAELLEKSLKRPERLSPGQMVEAKVVSISEEWVFLDLGGKGEGYLDRKELLDQDGVLTVGQGDAVRAYFLASGEDGMRFTVKVGSGPGAQAQLEEAWRSGIPVDGTFTKEVKGGFDVKIGGGVRSFCPYSQSGLRREESKEGIIGRSLPVRITQFDEDGRNIVVSRRVLLEEEQRARRQALKDMLKEGMKITGTVTSLQKFGAFVDIGGVEGLIPHSEIGWDRSANARDVLSAGQAVDVVVKGLDWDKDRITLSLKDAMPDPWESAAARFPVGSSHTGTVARLVPFGAFVTLAPGIDGLAHISKLGAGKRIGHPKEVLKEGQQVEVMIEGVDRGQRRLSLSLAEATRAEQEAAADLRSYQQKASAEGQSMGTLGDLLKKKMDERKARNG